MIGTLCASLACQQERPGSASALNSSSTGSVGPLGSGGTGSDPQGTGEAGKAGETGAGGAAGESSTPSTPTCQPPVAFAAVASAFISPTPKDLALALNELTFDTSPISVVLGGSSQQPVVTVSYTTAHDGVHSYPGELAPTSAPAWILDETFGSTSAQQEGWLLVMLDSGPLEVPIRNIHVDVSTEADCTSGFANMTAVIPAETSDLVDDLIGATESAASGDRFEGDVTIRGIFVLELVEFANPV